MKKLLLSAILLVLSVPQAHAGAAFLKYSYKSGMNTICVYDHLGSEVSTTISATSLCQLSIEV